MIRLRAGCVRRRIGGGEDGAGVRMKLGRDVVLDVGLGFHFRGACFVILVSLRWWLSELLCVYD